jgi:hypothetical protein
MSKADTLLKKATFFERLALYSDRKTFLQSLAQGGATDPNWMGAMSSPFTDANIKSSLERVSGALSSWVSQYGNRVVDAPGSPRVFPNSVYQAAASVMNAAKYSQFDNQLLGQVNQALQKLSAFLTFRDMEDDAKSGWQQIVFPASTQAMDSVGKAIQAGGTRPVAPAEDDQGPAFPGMGLVPMEGHAVPEKEAPQTKPTRPALPQINKQDQAAIFKFVTDENLGVPVGTADGVIGKVTRDAIEAVKNYFKRYPTYDPSKGGHRMTDQEAFTAAKTPK